MTLTRLLIVFAMWSCGLWWAYSGAEPPRDEIGTPFEVSGSTYLTNHPIYVESANGVLTIRMDGKLMPDATQPNQPLTIADKSTTTRVLPMLIAKAPPEATVPLVLPQVTGAAMDLARLRIIWDLVENGNVTTPANYASSKVDYIDIAKVTKYGYPYLRVHCKWSQTKIDNTTAEEQALAIIDHIRWHCTFPFKSEQADMKAAQAAAVAAAEKDIATDFGTAEYVPPVADAGGPYTGTAGTPVAFDGSGSTDDGSIASYSWDCGDSGTETGETPSHTYASPGEYTITLTVTDDRDLTDEAETTATISAP